jgi:prepilin-type N-terminal cleavage/methylation domain-containing protein
MSNRHWTLGIRHCIRPFGRGFTLMELLVSVAIMVMMMVAFGMILSQSQKVVAGSENLMRSNNTAAAIARTIQEDLRKITKNGFLCIGKFNSDNRPYLLFTTAGTRQSRTGTYRTLDGLSVYGWTNPQSTSGAGINYRILFYQGWLLWNTGSGNEYDLAATDVLNTDLARLQTKSKIDIDSFINSLNTSGRIPADNTINYPPDTYNQISNFAWQILSPEVNSLDVAWTDGTNTGPTNYDLNWYGIFTSGGSNVRPKDTAWNGKDITTITNDQYEFNDGGYRALWTHHNQNNWPKALRIKFQTYDPTLSEAMAEGTNRMWYEVIVPIN